MFLSILINRLPGKKDANWEKIVETFSLSPDAKKEAEEATKKVVAAWEELTSETQKTKMLEFGIPSELVEKWEKEMQAERR